ncbi:MULTISPECIES: DNA primase [unclassified Rhizobacter]|uniref:DNA primase n=1 Tax=unclassified Rhizobacter TaxID=2640088 RepID=UPI0006FF8930|nr:MULTISPECIES: DNA primase [unclassified Rhizobacter]KQU75643.1 DNA primase [Rhizobacter sp. Root29]KQW07416.1 DNA primase [Rhizobacter sp. Root1238]KRB18071.1 DNA primase [Rhizobacter sp. Root16D2]
MIPPSFIQELLSRIDVVEVVGRHVQLKKAGINHKGLCPFHGEKTPSFTVSPTRQTYHCFGCGVHGNALGFLMEYSGMGFLDAVRDLAQQAGLTVPEDDRSPQERERAAELKERQATLSDVLAKASESYRKQLKGSPRAIDYLKGRGLSGEIAAAFGLGYAPDGWRALASVFPRYDDPLLEESGLVISQGENDEERKRYDRFRDRIMFPIRSVQGDVIGFGGRVLDKGEPKYLNSPETPVFVKGRELYGLHEARAGLRKRGYALVVEGYMDVVALAQHGFDNAVATLGTACTAEHVQKLFRFTESVVFSFDGDAAGRRAAGRALEASLPLASDTRTVRFLFLPTEHDPDSYVRELGAEAFEACVAQAVPLSRQLVEAARDGGDLSTAEGRAKFLANAKPLWSALPDGALKLQLLAELAQQGGIGSADLTQLWQASAPSRHGGGSASNRHEPPTDDSYGPPDDGEPAAPRERFQRRDGGTGGGGRKWTKEWTKDWKGKRGAPDRYEESGPFPPQSKVRTVPTSPADTVLRLLLLHSDWWDQLGTDDHQLLHELPAPHGSLVAWLERHLLEHGATPWAVLEQALHGSEWADDSRRLVPPGVLQDEMQFADLRRVVDGMWVELLSARQEILIRQAATDPSALARWRELDAERRLRLQGMKPPALT